MILSKIYFTDTDKYVGPIIYIASLSCFLGEPQPNNIVAAGNDSFLR